MCRKATYHELSILDPILCWLFDIGCAYIFDSKLSLEFFYTQIIFYVIINVDKKREVPKLIGEKFTKLFNRPTKNLMIPASQVAVVNENDSLLHAILVLSSSGYQIIPVIDENNCIRGLISIPQIVKSFDNLSLFNEDKLAEIKVKEAMNQVVPILFDNYELEDVISLLIDNNFVCVTLKNGYFLGIIPRKVVLERFTQVAHNLEKEYKLIEKGNGAEWINRPNIIIGSKEADKQFLVKFHLVSLMAIYETLRVPYDDGAIVILNLQQSFFANYIF